MEKTTEAKATQSTGHCWKRPATALAVFEGTVEYQILNQKTADDDRVHTRGITTIDDELAIILDEGLTGTDAPTVTYDGDHVREDAPAYTGEISFDAATYNVADEVTVILVDPDLNIDADGIDIYTVDATVGDKTELLSLDDSRHCTIDEFDKPFNARDHRQQRHVRGNV